MASAQPSSTSTQHGIDDVILEFSSGSATGANAFKLFVQRAQLVVAGLMHVSILLLPRLAGGDPSSRSVTNTPSKQKKGSHTQTGAPSNSTNKSTNPRNGIKTSSNALLSSSSSNATTNGGTPAVGFPADGSDFATWQSVNSALERHAASGLDWENTCVYNLSENEGPRVRETPPYPLTATAAFHASQEKKEAIVCNDYDCKKGPHYADWAELRQSGARSMASAPMFTHDNKLIGVLTLASTSPHAFDRSRVVWMLAMALAPLAATLQYAAGHALQLESFIARLMPSLLEQNYERILKSGKKGGKGKEKGGGGFQRSVSPSRNKTLSVPLTSTLETDKITEHTFESFNSLQNGVNPNDDTNGVPSGGDGGGNVTSAETMPGAEMAPKTSSPALSDGIFSTCSSSTEYAEDPVLEWGDFFFNLVSMCIVYAYISDTTGAMGTGANQTAVRASLGIAAVDIILLGLRWFWSEQNFSYGGILVQIFSLYRLIVLPVVNTWMTWSLMNKLGVVPGGAAVVALGVVCLCLLVMGLLRVRFLLHAPLQLASVLFSAASTTEVCTRAFGESTGMRCLAAISLMQLMLGVLLPSLLAHMIDVKTDSGDSGDVGDSGGKKCLPHVQVNCGVVAAAG